MQLDLDTGIFCAPIYQLLDVEISELPVDFQLAYDSLQLSVKIINTETDAEVPTLLPPKHRRE